MGQHFPLTGSLDVGRDASASLRLDDNQVSRHHARITNESGRAFVEDAGSSNGTYVNDQPALGRLALNTGDDLRFGLTVLRVREADDVARRESVVGPSPDFTVVPDAVLNPVDPEELSAVDLDTPPAAMPSLMVEETEPAFVPRHAVGGDAADRYGQLAHLVDAQVKNRTTIAAMGFLSIAAIVVLVWLGAK